MVGKEPAAFVDQRHEGCFIHPLPQRDQDGHFIPVGVALGDRLVLLHIGGRYRVVLAELLPALRRHLVGIAIASEAPGQIEWHARGDQMGRQGAR
ncbi:hypothetical protein D3C81_2044770 [compost metagenome]